MKGGILRNIALSGLLIFLVLLPKCKEKGVAKEDQELNQETFTNALATLVRADTVYDEYISTEGDSAAVESLVEWFNRQANVDTARICIDWWTIDIVFNNGLGARYHTEPLDAGLGYSPDYKGLRFQEIALPDTYLLHAQAYILAPFTGQGQYYNAAQLVYDTLEHFGYDAYLYQRDTVTVDSLQEWLASSPGLFVIFTHGSAPPDTGDTVIFWSGERVTDTTEYWSLLDAGELKISRSRNGHSYYGITPLFVQNHARFRHPGIAYIAACHNGVNRSMADAFLSTGAKAYLSFRDRIRYDHCFQVTRNLFNFLADTSSIQQAYDNLSNNHGLVLFTNTHAEYMLGPNFACGLHNTRDHIAPYATLGTLRNEQADPDMFRNTIAVCGTVSPEDSDTTKMLIIVCFGPWRLTPADRIPLGTYNISDSSCALDFRTIPSSKEFGAAFGCVGVSGHVHLSACGPADSFAVGSYSGTLGWWAPEHRPDSDPPDETIEVNGYFKVLVRPNGGDTHIIRSINPWQGEKGGMK